MIHCLFSMFDGLVKLYKGIWVHLIERVNLFGMSYGLDLIRHWLWHSVLRQSHFL